jgi:bifunctional UDP-N-acetylglucosamine pyrophosphorylase/glucosamine-1-phosphate N-acetyltransferase
MELLLFLVRRFIAGTELNDTLPIIKRLKEKDIKVTIDHLGEEVNDPKKMGRIVRDQNGNVAGIVETKDASDSELQIKEVNPGLYVIDTLWLEKNIDHITPSPVTGEYYVTDLIGIAISQKQHVEAINFGHTNEWQSVTTQEDIAAIEYWLKRK